MPHHQKSNYYHEYSLFKFAASSFLHCSSLLRLVYLGMALTNVEMLHAFLQAERFTLLIFFVATSFITMIFLAPTNIVIHTNGIVRGTFPNVSQSSSRPRIRLGTWPILHYKTPRLWRGNFPFHQVSLLALHQSNSSARQTVSTSVQVAKHVGSVVGSVVTGGADVIASTVVVVVVAATVQVVVEVVVVEAATPFVVVVAACVVEVSAAGHWTKEAK